MKIVLTVKGVGLGAWLDDDFSHCGFVMIVDDDDRFDSWKNPPVEGEDQTSQKLTDFIIQTKPDILITGKISEAQKNIFTSQNIEVLDHRNGFVLELLEEARHQ